MFLLNELAFGLAVLLAQPAQAPSLTFDPMSPQATNVHWTITLSAPYCGGFRIGDGVYVQPEPPLALPADVPADAVLFNGQAADVVLQDGITLRAFHHQAFLLDLGGTRLAQQEGHVGAALMETRTEIAADRAATEDQDLHVLALL